VIRPVVALFVASALAAAPTLALARSPLKPADMKTIRHDSLARAKQYRHAYRASSSTVRCSKTTPYTARCFIKLRGAREASHRNCTITTVYAVVGDAIAGQVGRDGCA
jgi:hypothetical protein